jgi:hypothetical protein
VSAHGDDPVLSCLARHSWIYTIIGMSDPVSCLLRSLAMLLAICVSAMAVEIPETFVVDGQTYNEVVYQSHDASRLKIMHESGIANLLIANLPKELQAKLDYDPKAATAAEKALHQQQAQAQATADRQQLAAKIQDTAIVVVGKIFQVVDGGILLDSRVSTIEVNPFHPEAKKVEAKDINARRIAPGDHVFVRTKQGGLVDGGEYSGIIYPIGTHSFTTVMGSKRTIPAFSDDRAVVLEFYGLE